DAARHDLARGASAVQAALGEQVARLLEWANWDDTVHYVKTLDPAYETANLNPGNLATQDADLIVFANPQGRVVKRVAFQRGTGQPRPFPPDLNRHLQPGSALLRGGSNSVTGLLALGPRVMLLAARPVLPSTAQGPPSGTIVSGAFLNDRSLATLRGETRLSLFLTPLEGLNAGNGLTPMAAGLLALPPGVGRVWRLSPDTVAAGQLLPTLDGGQPLALRVHAPRTVLPVARRSIGLLNMSLLGMALVYALGSLAFLRARVLRPAGRLLADCLESAGRAGVPLPSPDSRNELTRLDQGLRGTMNALLSSREALDAERQALSRRVAEQTEGLRQAELAERFAKLELESYLEEIADLVVSAAPDGRLTSVNRAWERLLGYSRDELRSLSLNGLLDPDDLASVTSRFTRAVRSARAEPLALRVRGRSGRALYLEGSLTPRLRDGQVIFVRAILHDVTARQRASELERDRNTILELIAADSTLGEVFDRLEGLMRAQGVTGASLRVQAPGQPDPPGTASARVPMPGGDQPAREVVIQVPRWALEPRDGGDGFEPSGFEMLGSLQRLVRLAVDRHVLRLELERRAHFDILTGLPNRAQFMTDLDRRLAGAARGGARLAVGFLDLDNFKRVNDTLGHAGGDEVLREAARRLEGAMRAGDLVARISGDEFTFCLAARDAHEAAVAGDRCLNALRAPMTVGGQVVKVSATLGLAVFPEDGLGAATLLAHADAALYEAKVGGRNRQAFYSPAADARARRRAALEGALAGALGRGEFSLVYQPQLWLQPGSRAGKLRGFEALLRWTSPSLGPVPPAEFVPVLEDTGLIVPVGGWVLRAALAQARAWQSAGLDGGTMAVNLSARQLSDPRFVDRVRALLTEPLPGPLEIELTESLLLASGGEGRDALGAVRALGVILAIDDFGTGYSSLAYLKDLQVDVLKVDQAFVRQVNDPDGQARRIIQAMLSMAHGLGLLTVAEGLETREQERALSTLGADIGQGFALARPLDPAATVSWLRAATGHPPAATAGRAAR
ncbi:MAG TPA: EAL domain-containing protein, partial [Deinococcales bacterium]|nr:EAL domain-containing protein [Deinococcales bacterium]